MAEIILLILVVSIPAATTFAYYENYPPYKFKDGPYKSLKAKSLSDEEIPKSLADYDFGPLHDAYKADVDDNGLDDFIVLIYSGAGTLIGDVNIYLRKKEGGYVKISYEASGIGIEDFCDINSDGKYEVIIVDVYSGKNHNYIAQDVYEFKNYRLVNADRKFKDFPKFVWMTYKPNDKDTIKLTVDEKKKHVEEKNASIKYVDVFK